MTINLNEGRLLDRDPYEIIDNPVVGQTYRLLEVGSDNGEDYLRLEIQFEADATSFAEHVHPQSDETFKVLSGELIVTVEGNERVLGPGEQITLPAGIPHTHRNRRGLETSALSEVESPAATKAFLRALAALGREGQTDDEGTPNLLPLTVVLDANPDLVYLSSPPIIFQKLLVALLAPIGRICGYTADYPPIPQTETV